MSPTEIEEILEFEPFIPLRITLASGDIINLDHRDELSIIGLSLAVQDISLNGSPRLRLLSILKTALIEPVYSRLQKRS